jgi:hypothetical protein
VSKFDGAGAGGVIFKLTEHKNIIDYISWPGSPAPDGVGPAGGSLTYCGKAESRNAESGRRKASFANASTFAGVTADKDGGQERESETWDGKAADQGRIGHRDEGDA